MREGDTHICLLLVFDVIEMIGSLNRIVGRVNRAIHSDMIVYRECRSDLVFRLVVGGARLSRGGQEDHGRRTGILEDRHRGLFAGKPDEPALEGHDDLEGRVGNHHCTLCGELGVLHSTDR